MPWFFSPFLNLCEPAYFSKRAHLCRRKPVWKIHCAVCFILCTARPLVTRILSDTLTTSGEEHPHVFCKSPARFETGHTPSKFPRGEIAHATSDIIDMLFHDHTQHCSAQPPKIILPHITNNFKGNAKKIPLLIENFLNNFKIFLCKVHKLGYLF